MKRAEAFENLVKVQQTYVELQALVQGIVAEITVLSVARSKADEVFTSFIESRETDPSSVEIQSSEFRGDNADRGEELWNVVSDKISNIKKTFDQTIDDIDQAIKRKEDQLASTTSLLNQSREELSQAHQLLESAAD